MTLKEWPIEERPREKLALHGAERLTDSELLAILIRTGSGGRSAVEIGRTLAAKRLGELATMSHAELAAQKGIGPSRASAILAAFELGRRSTVPIADQIDFSSPEAVYRFCGPRLTHLKKERFMALALNTKNRLLRDVLISEGDLNSSIVHPREVFEPLIRLSAAAVIFVHNHPSGDQMPSQRDLGVTERLRQVGEILGIKVLDHVIVAASGFYSFQAHGFLHSKPLAVAEDF